MCDRGSDTDSRESKGENGHNISQHSSRESKGENGRHTSRFPCSVTQGVDSVLARCPGVLFFLWSLLFIMNCRRFSEFPYPLHALKPFKKELSKLKTPHSPQGMQAWTSSHVPQLKQAKTADGPICRDGIIHCQDAQARAAAVAAMLLGRLGEMGSGPR